MVEIAEVKGIAWPFRFGGNGGVVRARGLDKIRANMRNIVTTSATERALEPGTGTVAHKELFRNKTSSTRGVVSALIMRALTENEPRVVITRVVVSYGSGENEGAIFAQIVYRVKETSVRDVIDLILRSRT